MSAVFTVQDCQSTWCKNTATLPADPQGLHPTITHNSYPFTMSSHILSSDTHTHTLPSPGYTLIITLSLMRINSHNSS